MKVEEGGRELAVPLTLQMILLLARNGDATSKLVRNNFARRLRAFQ